MAHREEQQMKLLLAPFAKRAEENDDGTLIVRGIASTESVDSVGEIVKASAMEAALPEFMRFPALRYMHTADAVGRVTKAIVHNGTTAIEALVVCKSAIA